MSTTTAKPTIASQSPVPFRAEGTGPRPRWVYERPVNFEGSIHRAVPSTEAWKTRSNASVRSLPLLSRNNNDYVPEYTRPLNIRSKTTRVRDSAEYGDYGFSQLHAEPVITPPPSPKLQPVGKQGRKKLKRRSPTDTEKSSAFGPFKPKNRSTPDLLAGLGEDRECHEKGSKKEVFKEKVKGVMKHLRTLSKELKDRKPGVGPTPGPAVQVIAVPSDAFSPSQSLCGSELFLDQETEEMEQASRASLRRQPRTQTRGPRNRTLSVRSARVIALQNPPSIQVRS